MSVGTVDRVIHGRSGVSEASKKRVEEILKQLDYQPNMYASALASNKKYTFICLLPQHLEGEYWTAVELGIHEAIATYSDFNTSVKINYYDPYDYHSFVDASEAILTQQPDGVMVAPTAPQYTKGFTDQLQTLDIPYIYIDSNIKDVPPLAFFGQNSRQSGYFAARMLMLLARDEKEIVIFRKIHEGIVGSNQQENREIGFRQYMEEHHPSCTILELDLHAERNDEDNEMLINSSFSPERKEWNHFQFKSLHYRRIPAKSRKEKFQSDRLRPSGTECHLPERRKRFLPHRPATGTARPQRHQGALRSPHFQERRDLHQLYAD